MPFRYPVTPNLREFLYDILYHFPEDKKFDLKGVYYRIGRSRFHSRKFADTASHEQILHITAMLGMKWFLVIYDDTKKQRYVRDLLGKYKEEKRRTELSDIVKNKLYVTSDKKFIQGLGILSDSISTDVYKQYLELSKAGFHARKWYKKLNTPTVESDRQKDATLKYLAKTIVSSYSTTQRPSLQQYDVIMLLYLYDRENSFVSFSDIETNFFGLLSQLKIKRGIHRLMKVGYIEKHISPKRKDYQITAIGIMEANKVLDTTLKTIK